MVKIGIFGGTFDPIHIGHQRVAEEFAEAFDLDTVLMMVAATPPHREPPVASPADRLRMVQAAVQGSPRLKASDIELVRKGPSFTLYTVKEVRKAAKGGLVWMALGGDAYALIHSWYRPGDVLSQVHLVVLTRPGYPVDLMASLPEEISGCYTLRDGIYIHDSGASLRTLQVSPLDVSSSMVRETALAGGSIRELVTAEVLQYIRQKGLYGPGTFKTEDL